MIRSIQIGLTIAVLASAPSLLTGTQINQSSDHQTFEQGGQSSEPRTSPKSGAWRTGYDRGLDEGRSAGRQDFKRNHGWDLDGQTELERADSGYAPHMGDANDYKAGYREGFRIAYRQGFNNARDGR
jgi:hypothetical protein